MADTTASRDTDVSGLSSAFAPISVAQRRYAMWLLLIIYILNFIDRQVLNAVIYPIKMEFQLSDLQIGLMSGTAFAIFYATLGIPIARLADRSNRPFIIAAALAIWSAFTALTSVAQVFWHLLLTRIGVGIGEAGCTPPAHSLIVDITPREKRASALAFYSMGVPIGAVVGTAAGGVLADAFGWRMAFVICGLPGLALAIIVVFTLMEPRVRNIAVSMRKAAAPTATVGEVLRALSSKRTFWLIGFAAAIKAFIGYGHAPFTGLFFLQTHQAEIAEMANYFGMKPLGFLSVCLSLIAGVGGVIGTLIGGRVADRYGRTDLRHWAGVPAIASLAVVPLFTLGMLAPSASIAIPIFGITAILGTLWYGPVYATAQSIAPPHMRAVTSAILLFVINLVGLGLGPLAVGGLSVLLAGPLGFGEFEGLRWALILSGATGILAYVLFWMARKSIREEIEG
jgi:MFS family permease